MAHEKEIYDMELHGANSVSDSEKRPTVRNRFGKPDSKDLLKPENADVKFPKELVRRIDYILVHPDKNLEEYPKGSNDYKSLKRKMKFRNIFEEHLKAEGFDIQRDVIGENIYVKLHTPFPVLCKEAEESHIEMPLAGYKVEYNDPMTFWQRIEDKFLKTDTEEDFISAPFQVDRLYLYEGHNDPELFFRPAMRSFLTYHILINMDIRNEQEEEEDPFSKKGLHYMLMKGAYSDAFTLHDESTDDPLLKEDLDAYKAHMGSRFLIGEDEPVPLEVPIPLDNRQALSNTWAKKWLKYQPLWKIRNYFGEKIALYFAWSGTLISTLLLPTILGFGIFVYGLVVSVQDEYFKDDSSEENTNITTTPASIATEVADNIADLVSVFQKAFDNEATPYFGLIMCLWGTIFLEVWKRKNYTLAYEWDVENYENTEPDRPQFYGTKTERNPVIPEEVRWIYPIGRKIAKYALSVFVLILMCGLVCICVAVVVLYRVHMTVTFCKNSSTVACLIVATFFGTILQAIFIMVLGRIYDKISWRLTDWENHRTQTEYDDALIIKLFAFQFVNSYTSLYYIAFFRGREYADGIFNLGEEYQDSCGTENNCMSMLSLQVLVLMIAKPLPKFAKDILIPWARRLWRTKVKPCLQRNCSCCKCCRKVGPSRQQSQVEKKIEDYMERERNKPELGDFTLTEYTEKVLVYGFLMLFCVSLPLGPLIALLVNLVDMRVDARRMLWWYRRPVATIAQDIGRWYAILQALNIIGVITNSFLIAYVSRWGTRYDKDPEIQLWIVIGFEHTVFLLKVLMAYTLPDVPQRVQLAMRRHVVFILKFLLAALIPDVPQRIKLAMKREKYQVNRLLTLAAEKGHGTTAKPIRETFNHSMIQPTITSDVGSAPPIVENDSEALIDERSHKKHKKKHKKHKKHRHPEGGANDEHTFTTLQRDPSDIDEPAHYSDPAGYSGTQNKRLPTATQASSSLLTNDNPYEPRAVIDTSHAPLTSESNQSSNPANNLQRSIVAAPKLNYDRHGDTSYPNSNFMYINPTDYNKNLPSKTLKSPPENLYESSGPLQKEKSAMQIKPAVVLPQNNGKKMKNGNPIGSLSRAPTVVVKPPVDDGGVPAPFDYNLPNRIGSFSGPAVFKAGNDGTVPASFDYKLPKRVGSSSSEFSSQSSRCETRSTHVQHENSWGKW